MFIFVANKNANDMKTVILEIKAKEYELFRKTVFEVNGTQIIAINWLRERRMTQVLVGYTEPEHLFKLGRFFQINKLILEKNV